MAKALFILGHAGSGKSQLAKRFLNSALNRGEFWVILDKDIIGERFSNKIFEILQQDNNDRDSDVFKSHIRDIEYETTLSLAAFQLKMGINVILPGPWTSEINNGKIFNSTSLGFPEETIVKHVYLSPPIAKLRSRIENRAHPKDKWKLENWDKFSSRLVKPSLISANHILTFNMFEDHEMQDYQLLKLFKE